MLEDYWLVRRVDTEAVSMLYWYMKQFRYVLKMDLTGDRLYSAGVTDYGVCDRLDIVLSDPSSQYQMSMMCGLWNTEQLRKILVPNETPWEVELNGTPRVQSLKDEMIVLGTRQWPIRHTLALRGGDTTKFIFDEMAPQDVRELLDYGYLSERALLQAKEYLSKRG